MADSFINSSGKDDWATPPAVVAYALRCLELDAFDLDAAALDATRKATEYLGPDHTIPDRRDALAIEWASLGGSIWLNPPYSRAAGGLDRWLQKCVEASEQGSTVAALFFARTDTKAWHDHVTRAAEVHLFRGRISFVDPTTGETRHPAPAPSCLVIWRPGNPRPPRFIHTRRPPAQPDLFGGG